MGYVLFLIAIEVIKFTKSIPTVCVGAMGKRKKTLRFHAALFFAEP